MGAEQSTVAVGIRVQRRPLWDKIWRLPSQDLSRRLSPSDLDKAGGGLLTGYNCLAETRYRSLVTDPRPRPPDRGDAYVSEMADFRTVIMKR
jgi:hypothetical protein